jgi:hypothetical protein
MKERENMCKFCDAKHEIEIESGFNTSLLIGKDADNQIYLRACGEDYTDKYYPKYCPECGKKLINNA